ncbi:MAG: glucose-6-phosphate isomerase [Campylobacterota bacterium]|nr:glucose-6-phosphate isomerase [Campylobacterota bacterium]
MKNKLYFECKSAPNLLEKISHEPNEIGYYHLVDQELDELNSFKDWFEEKHDFVENIVVIGIGGSSLGAKAVYSFLKSSNNFKRKLFFLESTDPVSIHDRLAHIDLKKSHFIVISKSGTTIETISILKYIYELLEHDGSYFSFVTEEGSKLHQFAISIASKSLFLPKEVGGRFSVLSYVGLLPLALIGVNVKELLRGAKSLKEEFFDGGKIQEKLLTKATYIAKNYNVYNINTIFAYSETLKHFCEWYVQLWGESLGKVQQSGVLNVGLTPIGLIGPVDQHSFLQLIIEGKRDKSVTFITIKDFENTLTIPDLELSHLENLDLINGIDFNQLINLQAKATLLSLEELHIPIDTIELSKIDEYNIGRLIFYYQLLTSLVGILFDVNTYDQPAVEGGKRILKEMLNKIKEDKGSK